MDSIVRGVPYDAYLSRLSTEHQKSREAFLVCWLCGADLAVSSCILDRRRDDGCWGRERTARYIILFDGKSASEDPKKVMRIQKKAFSNFASLRWIWLYTHDIYTTAGAGN